MSRFCFFLTLWLACVPLARAERIEHIYTARGGNRVCFLTDQGRVKCWGANDGLYRQLGFDEYLATRYPEPRLPFVGFPTGSPVVQLALSWASSCALFKDGSVKCWGRNTNGELGRPETEYDRGASYDFNRVLQNAMLGTAEGPALEITAGEEHYCARFQSGAVKCWGNNEHGELGIGGIGFIGLFPEDLGDALKPVPLGKNVRAIQITSGLHHTCVLTQNHQVKCWGRGNSRGILGLEGDRGLDLKLMGDALPALDFGLSRDEQVQQVAAGDLHTCVVIGNLKLKTTRLKCWGENDSGQLGYGDTEPRTSKSGSLATLANVDLGVPATDRIRQLTLGSRRACALFESGIVKCWGGNENGSLGLGDTAPHGSGPRQMGKQLKAISVAPGLPVREISGNQDYVCAIVAVNELIKCWGVNGDQVLGAGGPAVVGSSPEQMGNNLPFYDLGI